MPTREPITAERAGVFLPGDRISAKYLGDGTVIVPDHATMSSPHFDDDVAVRWDKNGSVSWHGTTVLRRL